HGQNCAKFWSLRRHPSNRRPRERGGPYAVSFVMRRARATFAWCWHRGPEFSPGVIGPRVRGDDERYYGIAKRRVLPPLEMSTGANPAEARPRVPQSPCSLISNLLSRVQSSFAPPQFSGL